MKRSRSLSPRPPPSSRPLSSSALHDLIDADKATVEAGHAAAEAGAINASLLYTYTDSMSSLLSSRGGIESPSLISAAGAAGQPIKQQLIAASSTSSTTHGEQVQLVQAAAQSTILIGGSWPSTRSYGCNFCGREFNSAQALGGHMNIHRRDRARLRTSQLDSRWSDPGPLHHHHHPPTLESLLQQHQTSSAIPSAHPLLANHNQQPNYLPFRPASLSEYYFQQPRSLSLLNTSKPPPCGSSMAASSSLRMKSSHGSSLASDHLISQLSADPITCFSNLPLQGIGSEIHASGSDAVRIASATEGSTPSIQKGNPSSSACKMPSVSERDLIKASSSQIGSAAGRRGFQTANKSGSREVKSMNHIFAATPALSSSIAQPHIHDDDQSSTLSSSLDLELRLGQSAGPSAASSSPL